MYAVVYFIGGRKYYALRSNGMVWRFRKADHDRAVYLASFLRSAQGLDACVVLV